MSELKTLKDLDYGFLDTDENGKIVIGKHTEYSEISVKRLDLKQEAIKHLEFQKKNIKRYSKKDMQMDVYATDVLRKWIAKFFNVDGGFSK